MPEFLGIRGLPSMAGLALLACCTASGSDAPSAAPDPAWQRCTADADCVASFGPCGQWVATGRARLKEQQAWARHAGRAMSCPENRDPAPPVACRAQRCAVVLTPKAH